LAVAVARVQIQQQVKQLAREDAIIFYLELSIEDGGGWRRINNKSFPPLATIVIQQKAKKLFLLSFARTIFV